jgi:hypothetical protein
MHARSASLSRVDSTFEMRAPIEAIARVLGAHFDVDAALMRA